MNKKILNDVLSELSEKRVIARTEAERKKKEVYEKIPELKYIDDEILSAGLKLMEASLDETVDYDIALERIKGETNALRKQREKILLSHGLSEDYCEPTYSCDKCKDRGYVNQRICECVKRVVSARSFKESGLGATLMSQNFDNFNLTYYLSNNDKSTYNYMSNLFADAKKYAEEFCGKGNLLMIGSTGLGKTHLSSAIAQKVIEKGYSVVYESAQNIFDAYEDKKFGRDTALNTLRFSNADLLIMDDLGTEHITPLSVSILYNLINERCNNSKALIISTNLSPDELRTIYKPRIFSRLFGDFKVMKFSGMDIRMQKLGV